MPMIGDGASPPALASALPESAQTRLDAGSDDSGFPMNEQTLQRAAQAVIRARVAVMSNGYGSDKGICADRLDIPLDRGAGCRHPILLTN